MLAWPPMLSTKRLFLLNLLWDPPTLLISPGACCWDARPGQVRAWAALSFALFAFARAFLSVPLCLLPCCCSPPAPALRALGAEATSGLAPPAADTRKP